MADRPEASEPVWILATGAAIEQLSLAAEARTVVVATSTGQIQLVDRTGLIKAEWHCDAPLAALAASEDGRVVALLDRLGNLHWRDRRGREHWSVLAAEEAQLLAVDATGWYATVVDAESRLSIFDRHGRLVSQFPAPVPLVGLAFSRESPELFGISEKGFVVAMSLEGELLWRSRVPGSPRYLAVSVGAVHVSSDAGLTSYDIAGQTIGGLTASGMAPRLAVAVNGERLLLADRVGATLLKIDGTSIWRHVSASPVVDLALDPLARHAWLAIAPNRLACFDLPSGEAS